MGILSSLFGGGIVKSLENIASEWITTDMESAEAKVVMVKALDPNGKMRRDLSRFACKAYGFYLGAATLLLFMSSWGVGGDLCNTINDVVTCVGRADIAADKMTGLFLPITASWASIVGASFGVNATNVIKGK